jgi:hypothetical protein
MMNNYPVHIVQLFTQYPWLRISSIICYNTHMLCIRVNFEIPNQISVLYNVKVDFCKFHHF